MFIFDTHVDFVFAVETFSLMPQVFTHSYQQCLMRFVYVCARMCVCVFMCVLCEYVFVYVCMCALVSSSVCTCALVCLSVCVRVRVCVIAFACEFMV